MIYRRIYVCYLLYIYSAPNHFSLEVLGIYLCIAENEAVWEECDCLDSQALDLPFIAG